MPGDATDAWLSPLDESQKKRFVVCFWCYCSKLFIRIWGLDEFLILGCYSYSFVRTGSFEDKVPDALLRSKDASPPSGFRSPFRVLRTGVLHLLYRTRCSYHLVRPRFNTSSSMYCNGTALPYGRFRHFSARWLRSNSLLTGELTMGSLWGRRAM